MSSSRRFILLIWDEKGKEFDDSRSPKSRGRIGGQANRRIGETEGTTITMLEESRTGEEEFCRMERSKESKQAACRFRWLRHRCALWTELSLPAQCPLAIISSVEELYSSVELYYQFSNKSNRYTRGFH
ncbi:unnamed protein product [Calypogeia fissa]